MGHVGRFIFYGRAFSCIVVAIKRGKAMSREQKSNKETKKQPGMTAKEKKAAKKAKKNEKSRMGE